MRRGGKRVEGGGLPGRARARRLVRVLCPAPALWPVPNRSLDPATALNVPAARDFWGQSEGCRYLGSCGSNKVEDEDSNLQPQYKESNCIATKLRSPKSLDLS